MDRSPGRFSVSILGPSTFTFIGKIMTSLIRPSTPNPYQFYERIVRKFDLNTEVYSPKVPLSRPGCSGVSQICRLVFCEINPYFYGFYVSPYFSRLTTV